MLLFRAINLNDITDLEKGKDINCSLIRTHAIGLRKNHDIYYDLCIKQNREYALDTITGHIAGARLRVGLSPWISTTKDFSFACSEYAIPQAGAYNEMEVRKPIILIESNEILSDPDKIKELRNTKEENIIIDLSNNNLDNLYGKAFTSESRNINMPGYNSMSSLYYELWPDQCNVKGFSNYALYAKEVVFFKQIRNENIKCIIYPLLQDILYGCNIDIEKVHNSLTKNIDEIYKFLNYIEKLYTSENNEFFKFLYPDYKTGNNLTDYLYNNYNNINGNNIYEKYDNLKKQKKDILKNIVLYFNNIYKCDLKLSKIIDDEILVFDYDNPIKISKKQINDLLIIKKQNILYKYDSKEKKYVFKNNTIDKIDIKKLIKSR